MAGVRLVPLTSRGRGRLPPAARAAWERALTPRTRAVILCNPNNPTGTVYTGDELEMVAEFCRDHGLFLIADEVYREFVYDGRHGRPAPCRSPAARTSWWWSTASPSATAPAASAWAPWSRATASCHEACLRMAQGRLSPPGLAQMIAVGARELGPEYTQRVVAEYQKRRDLLFDGLSRVPGVFLRKPEGAFYFVARLPVADGEDFARYLLTDFQQDGATVMVAPAAGLLRHARPGPRTRCASPTSSSGATSGRRSRSWRRRSPRTAQARGLRGAGRRPAEADERLPRARGGLSPAVADPIQVSAEVTVPASALTFRATRSAGPGGQNVNKVASKVELRVELDRISGLTPRPGPGCSPSAPAVATARDGSWSPASARATRAGTSSTRARRSARWWRGRWWPHARGVPRARALGRGSSGWRASVATRPASARGRRSGPKRTDQAAAPGRWRGLGARAGRGAALDVAFQRAQPAGQPQQRLVLVVRDPDVAVCVDRPAPPAALRAPRRRTRRCRPWRGPGCGPSCP